MKNITKLACWPMLQNLGFEPIRYRMNGQIMHVGAVLNIGNNELRIEPHDYKNRPYHVSYYGKNTTCNIHIEARHILPLINDILTSINDSK